MAVTVITERYAGGSPNGMDVYAEAATIDVKEGHLIVTTAWDPQKGNTVLGIYAPDQWLSANTDDHRVYRPGEE